MNAETMTPVLAEVQEFLRLEHRLYLDGSWSGSNAGATLPVFNPATGHRIATVPDADVEDVDRAVRSAHAAFVSGHWRRMLPAERERILLRYADLVESHAEELAQLETLEQGKSINIARAFELGASVSWMRYAAGLATKISGRSFDVSIPLPPGARYTAYTRREPIGVVAGIVPWNFPLMIGTWKIMPALAAGCSIVLKAVRDDAADHVADGGTCDRSWHSGRRLQCRHRTRGDLR